MTGYNKGDDTVEVEFDTETGKTYKYNVEKECKANKLKLNKSTERRISDYQEMCEVGAVVEMHWTDDDLTDTGWSAGKPWA